MPPHKPGSASPQSPVASAAAALADELRRFEEHALAVRNLEINSEKTLGRARRAVIDTLASQRAIGDHVRELVAAIGEAQRRQQKTAEELETHAARIEARAAEFEAMMQRFAALGEEAQAIAARLAEITPPGPDAPPEERARVSAKLGELETLMDGAAHRARDLANDARQRSMIDVHRQADALSQRIGASRDKLRAARATLTPSP